MVGGVIDLLIKIKTFIITQHVKNIQTWTPEQNECLLRRLTINKKTGEMEEQREQTSTEGEDTQNEKEQEEKMENEKRKTRSQTKGGKT